MRSRRLLILGLVLVLMLSIVGGASADMKKGKVKGSQFTSPDGISFVVPKGFSVARQENKKDGGFFRIVLGGRADAKGFGPAIMIDITPGTKDLEAYTGRHLMQDLSRYPIAARYDKYTDATVLGDKLFEDFDTLSRECLIAFRLNRFSESRVAFSYYFCFNTDKNFVRASYICFGAQRTLTEDIPKFMELYNSLVVP